MRLKVVTTTPVGVQEFFGSPTADLPVQLTPATSLQFGGTFTGMLPASPTRRPP